MRNSTVYIECGWSYINAAPYVASRHFVLCSYRFIFGLGLGLDFEILVSFILTLLSAGERLAYSGGQ